MTLTKITDLSTVDIYRQLRDKSISADNSFIADSPKVVNLLLETDLEIKSILATQAYYDEFHNLLETKKIPFLYLADKELMQTIVGHTVHHNCMMHGVRPQTTALDKLGNKIIMLPTNH